MSEFDEWQGNAPASEEKNENGAGREGYRPSYNRENNDGQSFNRGERPHRPRIARERTSYNANGQADRGFRPSGFGGSYSSDGDQPRQGGYNNGYNQRGGYNNQRGGYNNQRGGYNNQRGYNNGGYNNGGYNPNAEDGMERNEGYQPRQGGYNNGYNNQRGVYNNQRGGYNNQRGGYNPNAKYSMKKQIEYKEYLEDPNAPIRLNKFLANAGVCSRREADQFIQAGVVTVNGNVVTELGTKVQRTDEVHFHDQLVSLEKKVYVILNKPKDYVTTSDDPQQRKTVMELVKNCCRERIYPVGRLDRNTTGVLLFTNDGDLASKLTHPKFLKKKIYHVYLDKNCTAADMKQIAEGITLDDGDIKADAISYASETDRKQVGIEIHSGKNRIVRRIFESLGYKVCKLDRVMFAGLTKKGIKRGDWRFLTEKEVAMLHMGSFE